MKQPHRAVICVALFILLKMKNKNDLYFMEIALNQAKIAFSKNEVPIGCVLVSENGDIISTSHNKSKELKNSLKHAEINCIEEALVKTNESSIRGATLYVTSEPCLHCIGAISLLKIKNVVYGAPNEKYGFSNYLKSHHMQLKKINLKSGFLEEEIIELLNLFFFNIRNKKNK